MLGYETRAATAFIIISRMRSRYVTPHIWSLAFQSKLSLILTRAFELHNASAFTVSRAWLQLKQLLTCALTLIAQVPSGGWSANCSDPLKTPGYKTSHGCKIITVYSSINYICIFMFIRVVRLLFLHCEEAWNYCTIKSFLKQHMIKTYTEFHHVVD